ncbi:Uncharacterized protein MSYG_1532 [Malassezia sympodialis ATCC 42132]|uniref:Uncharacterized protein n=1 Tax=Malassezia sympodialis (strain ATCC 42132) TaxID=1230383 RepID=A0A1M8A445_MALS4|nr:Uncharacterized protein MSYG_1532 [Malassezia sympodialis ATCC 42132]
MNEENIDDDMLLSGLPSWKDNFQPPKRSSEILDTEKSFGSTPPKPQPSVTTITADDDARMALRMAALKTIKKRKSDPKVFHHSEASSSREGSSDAHSGVAAQHITKASVDSQEQRPTIPNFKKLIKQSAGKQLEYTDVDAPENSFEPEPILAAEMAHSRGSRQKISYADEYTAKVEPPSGDIEAKPWANHLMEASVGRRYRNPDIIRKPNSRQQTTSSSKQSGQSRSNGTSTQFIEDMSWRPLIIDLSDEEDEEISVEAETTQKISQTLKDSDKQVQREIKTSQSYDSRRPNTELLRKEKEIERMLARIQELETKKRACVGNKSGESCNQTLGKRSNSTEDDCGAFENVPNSTIVQNTGKETQKRPRLQSESTLSWLQSRITNISDWLSEHLSKRASHSDKSPEEV